MAKVKDFKSKFNARKETEKPKKVSKFSSFTENEAVEAVEEKAEISAPAPASEKENFKLLSAIALFFEKSTQNSCFLSLHMLY